MTAAPTTRLHCVGRLNELPAGLSAHGLEVRPASRAMDFLPFKSYRVALRICSRQAPFREKFLTSSPVSYSPSASSLTDSSVSRTVPGSIFRCLFCCVERRVEGAGKRGLMYDKDDSFESEIYYDREPASAAVDRLHGLGYGRDDISVMMDDKTREKAFSALVSAKGSEGLAAGATIGGVLGAIVAGLTATGSVAAIAGTGGLATPLVVGPLAAA